MTKENLKKIKYEEQNGLCAISGKPLPENLSLTDLDRIVAGKDGGEYVIENVRLVLPGIHNKEIHGNEPIQNPQIVKLKTLMDDYRQTIKFKNKIENQIRAGERHDNLSSDAKIYFCKIASGVNDRINSMRLVIKKCVNDIDLPIIKAMKSVRGVAEISIAEVITCIDINKAEHPSALWKYAGLAGLSIDRYKKGQSGGGRQSLRDAMYNLASSFLRSSNMDYRQIYDNRKEKTTNSEKLIKERQVGGKIKEIMWKDAKKNHRHLDALRIMTKHWLADLWYVWRTLKKLSTSDLYVKEHLGHKSAVIDPKKMGWIY